jgi:hypothetical protein
MKFLPLLFVFLHSISYSYAQEGRPALPVETAESERVKTILKKAFPHELDNWEVEDESKTDGITWFHSSDEAVTSPFLHEYKIRYVRKNVSEEERKKWQAIAVDEAGVQKMLDENECEIRVFVNTFYHSFTAGSKTEAKPIAPFSLAFTGQHGARLFMGNGWKIAKTEPLEEGKRELEVTSVLNKGVPMTQIQSILLTVTGSPAVRDFFLKNTDLKSIQALIGQNKITQPTVNQPSPKEKPLTKPLEGNNEIVFTLDGGDFKNRTFRLKSSKENEFGYLRNNHPNPAVTDNAVTRILIAEDDDFTTKNKTGFLDITIPFIRKTGEFDVFQGAEKASFAGGINCWDGCEYSFDGDGMKVTISRYDAVGGFIEGTFEGEVKVGYKVHQPLDNDKKKRPNAQIKGHFKVHRKEDRY